MSSFDYFEDIFCINLDYRTDRWKHAQSEFKKVGILDRVKRFSALEEEDGRLGIIRSNLAIVKQAKLKGLKNVLIFEDDVKFLNRNPEKYLRKAISQIGDKEWYLFYLGANTHEKLEKLSKNLIIIKNAYAVHSMAYNSRVYDIFIKRFEGIKTVEKHEDILDVYLANEIQENYTCLMVNPMLTTQVSDYSNIEKKQVNQSYIEERFKKNIKK